MPISDSAYATREKVVTDFIAKVKNYVETSTDSPGRVVWPYNQASNASIMTVIHGSPDRAGVTVQGSVIQTGPAPGALAAGPFTPAQIITFINTWMDIYARTHRVTLESNTLPGNSTFPPVDVVVRLSAAQGGALSAVQTRVAAAITASGISSGSPVNADNFNALVDACQTIWKEECRDISRKTYDYNYCHSNHLSHANHGSRGRR
jgi:hypothetical protein